MVEAVIWKWVVLVAGEEVRPGGFGRVAQWLEEFVYTNDGILTSPQPSCLQEALDVLTGLLDNVNLHTGGGPPAMLHVWQPFGGGV